MDGSLCGFKRKSAQVLKNSSEFIVQKWTPGKTEDILVQKPASTQLYCKYANFLDIFMHFLRMDVTRWNACFCVTEGTFVKEHLYMWSWDCWPCNPFDTVPLEYLCRSSPVTWLPGNRNGVPPSFSFKAKCTSVFNCCNPCHKSRKKRGIMCVYVCVCGG